MNMLKQLRVPLSILVGVLILTNIIILDILFFTKIGNNSSENGVLNSPVVNIPDSNQSCPASCLSEIAQVNKNVAPTTKPAAIAPQQNTSQVKESLIPLGSGTGQSSEWTNIPGVGATIDSNNYGSIKSAIFEASITLPTNNNIVSLRLFDVTDNHPVWYSQIDSNGQTTAFLTSQPMYLESGSKFYQVQMKTLLTDQPVTLIQSRIRITTN